MVAWFSMQRFPRAFRWFVVLLVLTTTPGVGELVEGVVHAAIEAGDGSDTQGLDHHAANDCDDFCPDEGCMKGFFHSCRCNAPPLALSTAPPALRGPSESTGSNAILEQLGEDLPGHYPPPFRPPSA